MICHVVLSPEYIFLRLCISRLFISTFIGSFHRNHLIEGGVWLCAISAQPGFWKERWNFLFQFKTYQNYSTSILSHEWLILVLCLMLSKTISRPESFLANVAGDDYSVQMICFNVILYSIALPFLSTHLAYIRFLISIVIFVITLFHQLFHPFFKFLQDILVDHGLNPPLCPVLIQLVSPAG